MPLQLDLQFKTEEPGTMMLVNRVFLDYSCKSNRSYASKQCIPDAPTRHSCAKYPATGAYGGRIGTMHFSAFVRIQALAVFTLCGKGL